jgi:hypothetical protein
MIKTECYYGTHGTANENLKEISSSGFKKGKGLAGTGVYFWELNDYAVDLAVDWYYFSKSKRTFTDNEDVKCVIIYVGVEVPIINYLDFEEANLKQSFINAVRHYDIHNRPGTNKDRLAKLYDEYIEMIEEAYNTEVIVWRVGVNNPPGSKYPFKIVGLPICYVTSKPSIVEILEVEIKE